MTSSRAILVLLIRMTVCAALLNKHVIMVFMECSDIRMTVCAALLNNHMIMVFMECSYIGIDTSAISSTRVERSEDK